MQPRRLTLDNPVFQGTLRVATPRRATYVSNRPISRTTMDDVLRVRHQRVISAQTAQQPGVTKKAVPDNLRADLSLRAQASKKEEVTKKHRTPRSRSQKLIYAVIVLLVGIGIFVGADGFYANQRVKDQLAKLQAQASAQGTTVTTSGSGVPPTTEKPSDAVVRAYTVAPNLPKYIDIKKLGVHARVLSMSVDEHNELQAPRSIWDTGWYNASAQPGQAGAVLIDGHSGIGNTKGVFHYLAKLAEGDVITITKGDNTTVDYVVKKVETVAVQDVNMANMVTALDSSKPGLNVITCTGEQIPGTDSLDKRVLVHAVMQ